MHAALSIETFEACRIDEGIYALNPFYRRVNFYAQQVRAIALVDGIISAPNFDNDLCDLIVIGAGISGTTCAAAAIARGLAVTLIDKSSNLISGYERSTREIHPNIILWPFHKKNSYSNLPFLNWFCGPANTVAKTIREQWNQHFSSRCTFIHGEVKKISNAGATKEVLLLDGRILKAHSVVVCTGWQPESIVAEHNDGTKSEIEVPTRYWTDRVYDDHPVLVSGTGDGGLIDAASQVFGIRAVAVCRVISDAIESRPELVKRIRSIETRAGSLHNNGQVEDAFDLLNDFYSVLRLDADIQSQIQAFATPRTQSIDLIHRDPSPYSPLSSPINRVLAAHMINGMALINTSIGYVTAEIISEGVTYSLNKSGKNQFWNADRVIIRHGARPGLKGIILDEYTDILKNVDISILNSIIPRNIKWNNTVNTQWKAIVPAMDSRKTRGAFISWLRDSVPKMVNNALPVGAYVGRVGLVAGPNGTWTVSSDCKLPDDVKSLFPAVGKGFRVTLGESASLDFRRLG